MGGDIIRGGGTGYPVELALDFHHSVKGKKMHEDTLSAFALHVVTAITLTESLAEQYDKMTEVLKNTALMVGEIADTEPLETTAIALRDMKQNQIQQVAEFAEADAMSEFMEVMKLHCMWVPK